MTEWHAACFFCSCVIIISKLNWAPRGRSGYLWIWAKPDIMFSVKSSNRIFFFNSWKVSYFFSLREKHRKKRYQKYVKHLIQEEIGLISIIWKSSKNRSFPGSDPEGPFRIIHGLVCKIGKRDTNSSHESIEEEISTVQNLKIGGGRWSHTGAPKAKKNLFTFYW